MRFWQLRDNSVTRVCGVFPGVGTGDFGGCGWGNGVVRGGEGRDWRDETVTKSDLPALDGSSVTKTPHSIRGRCADCSTV
jgi:hypothetical protein